MFVYKVCFWNDISSVSCKGYFEIYTIYNIHFSFLYKYILLPSLSFGLVVQNGSFD